MKNKLLAKVMGNELAGKVIGTLSTFYVQHESTILTSGTIGFSLVTTAVAMKNAAQINYILQDAREALWQCNTKAEKNEVYKLMLKELIPLIAPIIIFQSATIGCAVFSKKQADKKIAEAAGALSIAQAAISQYQMFQKEAEESLGEKKYEKLQSDIYKDTEFDGRRFTNVASEGAPGEVLMIDKYSGKPFWSTTDRVENAAHELTRRLSPEGGCDIQTVDDWYSLIGNKDLIPENDEGVLATKFGYVADGYGTDDIKARFVDRRYIFPNGTMIPAFMVYLYPEPACIDDNI